jgi:predicted RNA-binding protein YlxR (DUF448 family)
MKNISTHPVKSKPLPRRTCVACRRSRPKKDLVRIIRTPGGNIEIDITGKKDGRGAYLCPARECFEKALHGNQLEYTLKSGLTPENHEQLEKYGRDLPGGID